MPRAAVTVNKEAAGADSECTGHAYDAAKCVTKRLPSDYDVTARLKKGCMQVEGTCKSGFCGQREAYLLQANSRRLLCYCSCQGAQLCLLRCLLTCRPTTYKPV